MNLTTIEIVWIVWGAFALAWIIAILYQSQITSHEEDQLFLTGNQEVQHQEQVEIINKVRHIQPIVRILGIIVGVITLGIIGYYAYDAYKHLT